MNRDQLIVYAQVADLKIQAMAMESANQEKIQNGEAPEYTYEDFMELSYRIQDLIPEI